MLKIASEERRDTTRDTLIDLHKLSIKPTSTRPSVTPARHVTSATPLSATHATSASLVPTRSPAPARTRLNLPWTGTDNKHPTVPKFESNLWEQQKILLQVGRQKKITLAWDHVATYSVIPATQNDIIETSHRNIIPANRVYVCSTGSCVVTAYHRTTINSVLSTFALEHDEALLIAKDVLAGMIYL
jgi:hypothetical protein